MELDIGWAIFVSLASVIAIIGILTIINLVARRSGNNNQNTKTNGLVR